MSPKGGDAEDQLDSDGDHEGPADAVTGQPDEPDETDEPGEPGGHPGEVPGEEFAADSAADSGPEKSRADSSRPELPRTGDEAVDRALEALPAIAGADPAEQLETYVGVHRALQDRLADSGV